MTIKIDKDKKLWINGKYAGLVYEHNIDIIETKDTYTIRQHKNGETVAVLWKNPV